MWSKKKTAITEERLNQELLNTLHSFIVKYRSIGNKNTADQLVDTYTMFNKSFSNVSKDVSENKETTPKTNDST